MVSSYQFDKFKGDEVREKALVVIRAIPYPSPKRRGKHAIMLLFKFHEK